MECGSQEYQSASSEVSLEESNRTDTSYEANRDIKTCEVEYCLLSKAKESGPPLICNDSKDNITIPGREETCGTYVQCRVCIGNPSNDGDKFLQAMQLMSNMFQKQFLLAQGEKEEQKE